MQLSEHFELSEFVVSQTAVRYGIDNSPTPIVIHNLKKLCKYCLEPIRAYLNKSIHISSGYRCIELNKKIGGSKNSQHISGCAADISVKGFTTEQLYQEIKKSNINYDQLIQEFDSWVHISFDENNCRKNNLRAIKKENVTMYLKD